MAKGTVMVDYAACMACGICVQACPFSYLELSKSGFDKLKKVYPQLSQREECTGCGLCASACPLDCLTAVKGEKS